jgi:acyl-CoA synthetase (NDP forming)
MVKKKSQKKKAKKKKPVKKKSTKKSSPKRAKPVKSPYIPEERAFDILKKSKIHIPAQIICKKEKELTNIEKKVGYPCIMKALGKNIANKSEINGIKKISDYNHAIKAFKELKKMRAVEKVLIQEKVDGAEIIVNISKNENFGYVASVGIGGEYAKIIKDASFRVIPATKDEIKSMLSELKAWNAVKMTNRISIDQLSEEILKIGKFSMNKKIKQLKIDPLICKKDNFIAVDVKLIL